MPAYNEAVFIEKNVIETVETLESCGYDFEVIIVDDGSPDHTHVHALRAKVAHPERVRVIRYDKNHGKGNAVMCGAEYAIGDVVAFLDADMDLHPIQLPFFLEAMDSQGVDVVVGSKLHPNSNVSYPAIRRLYSYVFYLFVRVLFGLPIKDTQTGLKVFRAKVLREVFPRTVVKRFAFDVELLANARRLGYKMVDVPVTLSFQRSMGGRINVRDAIAMLRDTLAIAYRMHLMRYYDRLPRGEYMSTVELCASREFSLDDHERLTAAR